MPQIILGGHEMDGFGHGVVLVDYRVQSMVVGHVGAAYMQEACLLAS